MNSRCPRCGCSMDLIGRSGAMCDRCEDSYTRFALRRQAGVPEPTREQQVEYLALIAGIAVVFGIILGVAGFLVS